MRGVAHPPGVVLRALERREQGASTGTIGRELAVPQPTVAQWCRGRLPADARLTLQGLPIPKRCETCGCAEHTVRHPREYAYLLGLYLGDGCLHITERSAYLRISLDAAYPGIIAEARAAILAVRGGVAAGAYQPPGRQWVDVMSYTRA